MSTLKFNLLRSGAAFGIAAGIVAAASGTAGAQETTIAAEADIVVSDPVAIGANAFQITMTPTGDQAVENPTVALWPDNYSALDFNSAGDERCTDGDTQRVECTIEGTLPAEGATFDLEVVVADDTTEETDLGFNMLFTADDLESASGHSGFILGSTELDYANEAPGGVGGGSGDGGGGDLPIDEEPTDGASDEPSESDPASESPTTDDQAKLPTTGADSSLIVGISAAVAAVGIGAIVLARRRKAENSW